jgi:PAS domain S-box-containing protein
VSFDPDTFEFLIKVGAATSTVGGGLFWLYQKVIKPMCTWGKRVAKTADVVEEMLPSWKTNAETIASLKTQFESNTVKLDSICKELKLNTGSTLRDMVSDIHSRIMLAEQFDKALADSLPYAVWHTDPDGDWVWVNRVWENLTGIPKERAREKGWIAAIHPDDREAVVVEWYRATKDQRDFVMAHRLIDTTTGQITRVHTQAFMMKSDRGEYLGHIGTAVPTTEDE